MATTTKSKTKPPAKSAKPAAKASKAVAIAPTNKAGGAGGKTTKAGKAVAVKPVSPKTGKASLAVKLGMLPGQTVVLIDAPESFPPKLEPLPDGVELRHSAMRGAGFDVAILFVPNQNTLNRRFSQLAKLMRPHGMLWVAWPGNGPFSCDVTPEGARAVALKETLIDNHQVDFDETWQGMRFIARTAVITEVK